MNWPTCVFWISVCAAFVMCIFLLSQCEMKRVEEVEKTKRLNIEHGVNSK